MLLFIFLLSRLSQNPNQNQPQEPIIPTSAVPTISFDQPEVTSVPEASPFALISVQPTQNTEITFVPITEVVFTFSDTVNPETLYYQVSPHVATIVRTSNNNLTILPENGWEPGITTITISNKSLSAAGARLDSTIRYSMKTGIAWPEGEFEGELE